MKMTTQETQQISSLFGGADAENTVAAALVFGGDDIDRSELLNRFTQHHFVSSDIASWIYRACAALNASKQPISFETVSDYIRRTTTAVSPSQCLFLASLYKSAEHVKASAMLVEELHKRRRLIEIAEKILRTAVSYDSDCVSAEARKEIDTLMDAGRVESDSLVDLLSVIQGRIDTPAARPKPRSTGMRSLDGYLNGGFFPGHLVVVGARTSHGKTAFGVGNLAIASAERGFSVAIITLEMTPEELAARCVSSVSGVPVQDVISTRFHEDSLRKFLRGVADLNRASVRIIHPHNRRLSNITRVIRQSVRRDGAQIVFLDYLQLVRHDDARMKRFDAVAEISGELKAVAEELKIPIVVLAQLNREADGEVPRPSHLRESGAIEQDADEILLIYRPDGDDGKPQDNGYILIPKNRNGSQGRVCVQFIGERCAFIESNVEPVIPARRRS